MLMVISRLSASIALHQYQLLPCHGKFIYTVESNHFHRVVTGGIVVPCVRILKAELEVLSSKYTSKFVLALKDSVHKRLTKYKEHDAFQTASVLDPRFKLNWCNESESQILRAAIIAKAMSVVWFPIQACRAQTNSLHQKSVVASSVP